jgi:hypothetical protein
MLISTRLPVWPKCRWVPMGGHKYLQVLEKMPACPDCQEDELILINDILITCMACGRIFHKDNEHSKKTKE